MSERLTKKRNGENVIPLRNAVCGVDIWSLSKANDNEMFLSGDAVDRLCEFEDKIEQGKIVELPCAVGSEAYHLTSADTLDELGVGEIFNGNVCSFSKDEKGLWIFCRYDNGLSFWYTERDIGRILFFDRSVAEAKLREMEGERK